MGKKNDIPLATKRSATTLLFIAFVLNCFFIIWYLIIFYRARNTQWYKQAIKIRRFQWLIVSYILFLPWFFEIAIDTMYLYWQSFKVFRLSHHLKENTPIYYSTTADHTLHFFFWIGFWFFVQLKVFKIVICRYSVEYSSVISNIEWKELLGLKTIQATSIFIRYRCIFGNQFRIFIFQLIFITIVLFCQIMARFVSEVTEQSIIIAFLWIDLLFTIWIIYYREFVDNFHFKKEFKSHVITSVISLIIYIIFIIIYSETYKKWDYFWYRFMSTILLSGWLFSICYQETLLILKELDKDWNISHQRLQNNDNHKDKLILNDVLSMQTGFESMMRFLLKEFSCETLLCYVECSQFIKMWGEIPMNLYDSKKLYLPLIWGYVRINMRNVPDDIVLIILSYHKHLYGNKNGKHNQYLDGYIFYSNIYNQKIFDQDLDDDDIDDYRMNIKYDPQDMVNEFPYFELSQFDNDYSNFEYIMQKYVIDNCALQINISHNLRMNILQANSLPGADCEVLIKYINQIKMELWSLLCDSFSRFKQYADDYTNIQIEVINQKDLQERDSSNQSLILYKDIPSEKQKIAIKEHNTDNKAIVSAWEIEET